MHAIYELKEMLCEELEEYGRKGELTAGALDVVDKLAHTIKNIDKIIEENEEYSSRSYRGGESRRSYRGSYRGSYERGRGSNAQRESRYSSEYSRDGDMVDRLRDLMNTAPDERTRQEIQRLITKMEQM